MFCGFRFRGFRVFAGLVFSWFGFWFLGGLDLGILGFRFRLRVFRA